MSAVVITIDGPSGSGKGTVAGLLAAKLGSRDDMKRRHLQTATEYIQRVRDLADTSGSLRNFFVLHYTANEGLLPDPLPAKVKAMMDDQRWSAMMLIHESIKECLVDPENEDLILKRLERVLRVLLKEGEIEDVSSNQRDSSREGALRPHRDDGGLN